MDLKQLEYFVRVAELGSFTRAAAVLRVAQPALSRQIQQLEASLRVRLLTRNGRGVVTTESGRRLLEHSRGILRQVSRVREEIEETRDTQIGRVAIGMPASIAASLTVPIVKAFHREFPRAKISIAQGRSTTLQEWLVSGRIDIAVLYDAPFSPLVRTTPLLSEQLVLVQAATLDRGEPTLPLVALADVPLIIPSRPNTMRALVDTELARLGLQPTIALEIDNVPNIIELVGDGFGSAVLSPRAIRDAPSAKLLSTKEIVSPSLSVELSMSASARRLPSALLDAAEEMVRDLSKSVLRETVSDKRSKRSGRPRSVGA